jgi:hypothetical protein
MNRLLAISMVLFFPAVVVAEDPQNLLKPVNKAESWRLEQHEGAQATLKVSDDTAVINAIKLTGTDWHIQAFQTNLDLKEGKEYTLKLKLTASQPRKVLLVANIDKEDWHEIGLHEALSVDKEVRPFEFTFRANGVIPKNNRIGFSMGEETGDLIVKEMTLTEKADTK